MESHASSGRDAVGDGAFEFGVQREHGAENFTERGQIVVGDPAGEAKELIVEDGRGIENTVDGFGCYRGLAIVELDYDACHATLAEGDEYTRADCGSCVRRDTVGEDRVEWDGEGYVAEFGH